MKKNKYAGQVKKRREAETLNASEKNMLAKVEQDRTLRQSLYHPIRVKAPDIPVDELIDYLQENGIGDAKLYNRLHRGLIVYVKHWERFLVWNGHHWREDDWNEAHQAIENVCENYLKAADEKQREADSFSDEEKDLRKKVQGIADKGYRRVDRLRSKTGQDDLLVMTRRTRQPLLIMPDFIDKQYYSLPCPNGVVDLRTGDLRDGRPEDYLLNACLTEYAPDMLELVLAQQYDCVVMEGTFGLGAECEGHMCLRKNIRMRDLLTAHGCWKNGVNMYLTHICPHWAPPHEEYAAIVAEEGMELGYDGQVIEI